MYVHDYSVVMGNYSEASTSSETATAPNSSTTKFTLGNFFEAQLDGWVVAGRLPRGSRSRAKS
jgi:hypothetical protein